MKTKLTQNNDPNLISKIRIIISRSRQQICASVNAALSMFFGIGNYIYKLSPRAETINLDASEINNLY